MPRPTLHFRRWLLLLWGAAALALAGCGGNDRFSYATETDEPAYREGQSLLKSGRKQEALSAFLKVIEKRGDDAPESHLEVGLLYLQHISDPVSAIYHFKKYLALRPNSPQAPLVKQRIDAALREFARTLPAQPLENQLQRVDLIAALDKLKVENELLKQQVADLQAGKMVDPAASVAPTGGATSVTEPAGDKFAFSLDTIPTVRTRPQKSEPPPVPAAAGKRPATTQPGRSSPAANQTQPAPARGAARKHTVQKGDTLSNLAQRYYGNRAKWRDIYAANRGVMKNEGDLRIGLELTIP